MHIGRIRDASRTLNAPRNWDKAVDGACVGLPVRDEMTAAGAAMTSAWYPTPEEIARIVADAPVYLTVLGTAHPPVAMNVGDLPNAS